MPMADCANKTTEGEEEAGLGRVSSVFIMEKSENENAADRYEAN